ncbi:MAG: calcium/sodium antiporter [bacterium]|nr:calcium/sodium antiporter [bacterium]
MITIWLPLLAGFILLYVGGEALVAGSVRLAFRFKVSSLVVGLTVVAFGTSSPELMVSVDAALRGADGIVVGSVVGSNLCNLLLVLGLAALLRPVEVRRKLLRVDLPFLIAASVALYVALLDGSLSRAEGTAFLLAIAGYTGFSIWRGRHTRDPVEGADDPPVPGLQRLPAWLLLVGGIVLLTVGANLFVSGAVELARQFGVSEALIGLTVVAVGTSLPEISSGVVAAWRGQGDLVVGNAVGSCIFNILCILGASAVIHPLAAHVSQTDLVLMALAPAGLLPFAGTGLKLVRWEGVLLLGAYVTFVVWRVGVG